MIIIVWLGRKEDTNYFENIRKFNSESFTVSPQPIIRGKICERKKKEAACRNFIKTTTTQFLESSFFFFYLNKGT